MDLNGHIRKIDVKPSVCDDINQTNGMMMKKKKKKVKRMEKYGRQQHQQKQCNS